MGLKVGDSLAVLEIRDNAEMALLRDSRGQTYELYTDECHALTFQHLVDTCRQTLQALDRPLAPDVVTEIKQALCDALEAAVNSVGK